MADDDSSDLSSLSSLSPPPSDIESEVELEKKQGILKFFQKVDKSKAKAAAPRQASVEASPPRPKRSPSPPHEYVLADNPDIAFIVMFRARFAECLPKTLATFGPQELEGDVVDNVPGERVEQFLCALLGLLLNRKQDVKPGHYNRALEEAISSHKTQWPKAWASKNPLSGGATFGSMTPAERLTLLRTLVLWSLSSSDVVKAFITAQYKPSRKEDDINIGISVQPWGSDGDKRRYFLVEGLDDTSFRVYRESNPAAVQRTWWSVAGSIDDLKALAEKLETKDGGPKATTLAKKITNSIPRFEATEEKRRRREYRLMRKQQFKRPEPGFSMYEGRTRGKRVKYTYDDDGEDEFYTDSTQARRSSRNTRNHTPAETGSVKTASGRQIRAPDRFNAETASHGTRSVSGSVRGASEDVEMQELGPSGRPRRAAAVNHSTSGWPTQSKKRSSEELESDEDEGSEPDFGDDEEEEAEVPEESEDEEEFAEVPVDEDEDDEMADTGPPPRLVIKLPIKANVDKDGKATLVNGNGNRVVSRPTTRPIHRNIVYSDDDETEDAPESKGTSVQPEQQSNKDAEATILAKAAQGQENIEPTPDTSSKPTPSPPRGTTTSLAFRGSPEKMVLAPADRSANIDDDDDSL